MSLSYQFTSALLLRGGPCRPKHDGIAFGNHFSALFKKITAAQSSFVTDGELHLIERQSLTSGEKISRNDLCDSFGQGQLLNAGTRATAA